ncbi:hypothetical protein WQQ_08670 [Hydrocarboniphaga effusa AP103]|uniref:Uncharacterized protein n=1 Tax=Hydrocarboniphaga effusa AP103 TaxID=1172194 RepID=I8TAJ0_9GAMM|nr:hypothetical protein WQQ_08670 [Hydrocarboniphaga effusa AP103]
MGKQTFYRKDPDLHQSLRLLGRNACLPKFGKDQVFTQPVEAFMPRVDAG